jgi:hypothetical protein
MSLVEALANAVVGYAVAVVVEVVLFPMSASPSAWSRTSRLDWSSRAVSIDDIRLAMLAGEAAREERAYHLAGGAATERAGQWQQVAVGPLDAERMVS